MMALTYVDHYDSFTYNLIAWLQEGACPVEVIRVAYDDHRALAAAAASRRPLVLSPGPKSPREAAPTLQLAAQFLGVVPILGVCLGHQILGSLAGGAIVRSQAPTHGLVKSIRVVDDLGLLAGLPKHCDMAAYHSLVVDGLPVGGGWQVTATCQLGEIAALEYRPPQGAWAFGVQFHPESFLSQAATPLLENWLRYLGAWYAQQPASIQQAARA